MDRISRAFNRYVSAAPVIDVPSPQVDALMVRIAELKRLAANLKENLKNYRDCHRSYARKMKANHHPKWSTFGPIHYNFTAYRANFAMIANQFRAVRAFA